MLEGARDYAIIFLELDGRIASWNKGAERIKGYRAEEIVGQQNLFSNAIKFRRREEAPHSCFRGTAAAACGGG
ncbi:MAG TPA: PAS domain S-box protein [Terriglobales bacterium]|nr:PAS domain S-box protein [Terriglobales bacterium]